MFKTLKLSLATLLLLISSISALNAEQVSIGVYPPVIKITAQPPAKVSAGITVKNFGDKDVSLGIMIKPFTASASKNGQVEFLPEKDITAIQASIIDRIQILDGEEPVKQINIPPNGTKNLTLNASVGRDDPLSDFYFSVIFLTENPNESTESSVQLPAGIATNVLFTLGEEKSEITGIIDSFQTDSLIFDEPVIFKLLLNNNGKRLITASGKVELTNIFGKKVGEIPIAPHYVLAGTSRYLTGSSGGIERPKMTSDKRSEPNVLIWSGGHLFGLYKATADIKLSDSGPVIKASRYFVVVPFSLLAALTLVLMLVINISLKIKRKSHNAQ